MSTWGDLINDALLEINAYSLIDISNIQSNDQNLAVRRCNRIIDSWFARKVYAFSQTFAYYTLTPNHAPHLIGPGLSSPDFATPNGATRPTVINSASLVLTGSTPSVDAPMNIRDKDWWANERVKSLTSNVPTDLYYEPDFVSGQLNFWPVPAYAYGVRLEMLVAFAQIPTSGGSPNLSATFSAPPGYELALLLTLAEELCTAYEKPVPLQLAKQAARARTAILTNNINSPRTSSADWGTRGRWRARGSDFNYYTGGPL
jgi:hypothetical protein